MTNKKEETKQEEKEVKKVVELEEGELEDVSGGARSSRELFAEGDNTWCDEGC
ncbi:hypothetical protein [Acanthopleuribacter pedis]|uniref:Uncharacterized protein n=1 Tax=Acanthopleuribacter pedis TaxID=442870 RepID=A0A8J7U647_9BACT|nr:hypothetical protein [Acanthopleuribacter pedis]MBO1323238.1 hypothetical protein [Acanthopleuribacter pedis]